MHTTKGCTMTTHITKTWFDGKTVVTQEIPEAEIYNQEIAADPKAFHGFPSGSVSTPNAGGKCVTAGETAPIKEIDPNAWAFDRGLEST